VKTDHSRLKRGGGRDRNAFRNDRLVGGTNEERREEVQKKRTTSCGTNIALRCLGERKRKGEEPSWSRGFEKLKKEREIRIKHGAEGVPTGKKTTLPQKGGAN